MTRVCVLGNVEPLNGDLLPLTLRTEWVLAKVVLEVPQLSHPFFPNEPTRKY